MNHTTIKGQIEIYVDNGEGLYAKADGIWYDITRDQQIWSEARDIDENTLTWQMTIDRVHHSKESMIVEHREPLSVNAEQFVRTWDIIRAGKYYCVLETPSGKEYHRAYSDKLRHKMGQLGIKSLPIWYAPIDEFERITEHPAGAYQTKLVTTA